MTKSNDSLRQFVELRASLDRERTELQQRLQQVESALSGTPAAPRPAAAKVAAAPARAPQAVRPAAAPKKASPAKPAKKTAPVVKSSHKSLGMRETIAKLVAKSPLRIGDIVNGMQRSGYVFKSSNPTNSVGAYLYGAEGKKCFVRNDGKFSLKPGAKL